MDTAGNKSSGVSPSSTAFICPDLSFAMPIIVERAHCVALLSVVNVDGIEGNYKIDKGPDYHVVTYDRCMEHMRQIFKNCPTGQ